MNNIVGRNREIKELSDLYDSGKAEFVAVYGRRRVGKTFLVDECFKGKITFRHAGLSPVDKESNKNSVKNQLKHFYYSLQLHGMKKSHCPTSWMEAFFMLSQFLEKQDNGKRQVVFIDELPWLDTPRSGFITAFEGFWNTWGCHRDNLMLIVCGSANSWMLNNLVNNHGGLYGRTTYEVKLHPFNLSECEAFFKKAGVVMSRYDIVQSHMIFGGIPFYLRYIKKDQSLAQNIDQLFFEQEAKLKGEYDRLFASVFTNPDAMKHIVETLATRNAGLTRAQLIKETRLTDSGFVTKMLNALIASDFVQSYVPFGQTKRNLTYRLSDPFCIFYIKFVKNKAELDHEFWMHNVAAPAINSWRGIAFEQVCLNHIPQIKAALGILGVSSTQSQLVIKGDAEKQGVQIDLIINRKDNIVNLCEIKFYNEPFTVTKEYQLKLVHRQNLLAAELPKRTAIHQVLISTYGVVKNEYSNIFQSVIDIDALF